MFRSTLRLTARPHLLTRVATPRSVLTQIPINTLAHSRSIYITGDPPFNYAGKYDHTNNPTSSTDTPPSDPFADHHHRIRCLQTDYAALRIEVRQLTQKLEELEGKVSRQHASSKGGNHTGLGTRWYSWVLLGFVPAVVGFATYHYYLNPARAPGWVQVVVKEEKEGEGSMQGGGG